MPSLKLIYKTQSYATNLKLGLIILYNKQKPSIPTSFLLPQVILQKNTFLSVLYAFFSLEYNFSHKSQLAQLQGEKCFISCKSQSTRFKLHVYKVS